MKPAEIERKKSANEVLVSARMYLEKKMNEIGKILESKHFSSAKEANAYLDEIMNSGEPLPQFELTPLEKAQDMMYDAWESSGRKRTDLAREAMETCEDCADAYVLLADAPEKAGHLSKAKALYAQGVAAGERALGREFFERNAGHFWGLTKTRPYMRARLGLANCLWKSGERGQAISHYREMLRLNPYDNQGVRYALLECLVEQERDEEAGEILQLFEGDCSACWLYPRALLAFRQKGESPEADACLKEALGRNKFVPGYLLGRRALPKEPPQYVELGGRSEAVGYAADGVNTWRGTNGALGWLAKTSGFPPLHFNPCPRCLRLLEEVKSGQQERINRALKDVEKLREPHLDESFGRVEGTKATGCMRFLLDEFMKMCGNPDGKTRWLGLRGIIKIRFTHAIDEREKELADLFLRAIVDDEARVRQAAVYAFDYLRPFEKPAGYVDSFRERFPFQEFDEGDYVELFLALQGLFDEEKGKKKKSVSRALDGLWCPMLEELMEQRGFHPTG